MMCRYVALVCIVLLATVFSSSSVANAQLAPNAPPDQPVRATSDEQVRRMEAAVAPYIEKARKTYPEARARYLAGLPKGETFFVTAKLTDARGRIEVAFVRVTRVVDGKITGRIASEIAVVHGYKEGDQYTLPEGELVDWTISKPDGSEEGNVVGKFLDSYRP